MSELTKLVLDYVKKEYLEAEDDRTIDARTRQN